MRQKSTFVILVFVLVISVPTVILGSTTSNSSESESDDDSHDRSTSASVRLKLQTLRVCLASSGVSGSCLIARDTLNSQERAQYKDLNFQWNKLHGEITPLAYLLANRVSDVQAAVRCCVRTGVRIVPRSGGHSYVKYGFGDAESLIVDLQRMNQVSMDKNVDLTEEGTAIASIGAGARVGKVYYDLWTAGGWTLPLGLCPTVGIAGYTLGGGYGYYSRLLGLASDNVLEMEMVDATGKLLTVNNFTDPDLYWALRGGGGGSFGIVTRIKFRIHTAPSQIVWAVAEFELDTFPEFFRAWQAFVTSSDLPNHLGTFLIVKASGLVMELYSMGGSRLEVDHVLDKWFTQAGAPPRNLTMETFPYKEFMVARVQHYSTEHLTHPRQLANITRHNAVGWKKVKSIYVGKVLDSDQEVNHLYKLLREYLQWSGLGIEHYGGAIDELSPSETAFMHRTRSRVLYSVQLRAFSPGEDGRENQPAMEAMKKFFDGTKLLFGHTESYQNYLDEDLPDYLRRYYGPNLERLVAVKQRLDRGNVFHNPRSIPLTVNTLR